MAAGADAKARPEITSSQTSYFLARGLAARTRLAKVDLVGLVMGCGSLSWPRDRWSERKRPRRRFSKEACEGRDGVSRKALKLRAFPPVHAMAGTGRKCINDASGVNEFVRAVVSVHVFCNKCSWCGGDR